MHSEHKMQVYFSKVDYQRLRERAHREGRSIAAVVRDAVAEYLEATLPPGDWSDDAIGGLVGIAAGEPRDSSNIDDVLYGDPV